MKKKIIFCCPWERNRNRSWSGTHFNVYSSLMKYYNVKEIDIGDNRPYTIIYKLLRKFKLVKNDMGIKKDIHYNKKINKMFKKLNVKNIPCIQFNECPNNITNIDSYIYIDLCVDFLYEAAKNNSKLYKYCGIPNLTLEGLEKRSVIQNNFFKECKGIFTMGNWMAEYLSKIGIEDSKIHPIGGGFNVLPPLSLECNKKTDTKILFVGKDFYRKGGDLVCEAFQILLNKMPNAELHIAGPTSLPEEFLKCNNIYFYGEINYDKVQELYNKCDIFVMPSRFEAYGLVFIEALSYGLPCIGKNDFEMPYFIEDNVTGKLINGEDCISLAESMYELLNNKTYKQNVVIRHEEYISKYSWDSVVKRMVEVIDNN